MKASQRLTAERAARVLAALAALLAASLVVASLVGGVRVDLARALRFHEPDNTDFLILFRARVPRVLLAAVVGGGLAAAGAAVQALFRNALASPDVIGVAGGASVGAAAVLALGLGEGWASPIVLPAAAFAGSLASIGLIVRLSTVHGRLNPYSLLLVGVIVNTIAAAAIMMLSALVESNQAQSMLLWLAGNLGQRSYPVVGAVGAYSIVATAVLWANARFLNLLALGEETARQLGADVDRQRRIAFLASALLVGASVSICGIIGFVGLLVPHCLRLLIGSDQRLLIPASFLGGSVFLVWADLVARWSFAPTEIPVGVVTALVGGPFFIYLLRRAQQEHVL